MPLLSSSLPRKSSDAVGFPQSLEEFPPWGKTEVRVAVGVFICIFLGQRTVSPAHPSPASLCHLVLSSHYPGVFLDHSVLSISPSWCSESRSIIHEGRRCSSTVMLTEQGINPLTPMCPKYQTPRGAHEVGPKDSSILGYRAGVLLFPQHHPLPCVVAWHILHQLCGKECFISSFNLCGPCMACPDFHTQQKWLLGLSLQL